MKTLFEKGASRTGTSSKRAGTYRICAVLLPLDGTRTAVVPLGLGVGHVLANARSTNAHRERRGNFGHTERQRASLLEDSLIGRSMAKNALQGSAYRQETGAAVRGTRRVDGSVVAGRQAYLNSSPQAGSEWSGTTDEWSTGDGSSNGASAIRRSPPVLEKAREDMCGFITTRTV